MIREHARCPVDLRAETEEQGALTDVVDLRRKGRVGRGRKEKGRAEGRGGRGQRSAARRPKASKEHVFQLWRCGEARMRCDTFIRI